MVILTVIVHVWTIMAHDLVIVIEGSTITEYERSWEKISVGLKVCVLVRRRSRVIRPPKVDLRPPKVDFLVRVWGVGGWHGRYVAGRVTFLYKILIFATISRIFATNIRYFLIMNDHDRSWSLIILMILWSWSRARRSRAMIDHGERSCSWYVISDICAFLKGANRGFMWARGIFLSRRGVRLLIDS